MEMVIDYGRLEDAAGYARDTKRKLDDYYSSLNRKVQGEIVNYRNQHSGLYSSYITSAQTQVSQKMQAIANESAGFANYATKIDRLASSAKNIESKIINAMNNKLSAYCAKYGLEYHPSSEEVESENIFIGFIKGIGKAFAKWGENLDVFWKNLKDSFRQWYNYYGGKEVINLTLAVLGAILAIVVAIVAWPALSFATFAAALWSILVIAATVITLAVSVLDAIVQVSYLSSAVTDAQNGQYFSASWNTKQSERGFTGELREHQMYTLANIIDTAVFVSSIITFVDGFKNTLADLKKTLRVDKLFDAKHPLKSIGDTFEAIGKYFKDQGGISKIIGNNLKRLWGDGPADLVKNLLFGTDKNGLAFKNVFKGSDGYNWKNINKAFGYLKTFNKLLNANSQTDTFKIIKEGYIDKVVENGANIMTDFARYETVNSKETTIEIETTQKDGTKTTEVVTEKETYTTDNSTGKVVKKETSSESSTKTVDGKGKTVSESKTSSSEKVSQSANQYEGKASRETSYSNSGSDNKGNSYSNSESSSWTHEYENVGKSNETHTVSESLGESKSSTTGTGSTKSDVNISSEHTQHKNWGYTSENSTVSGTDSSGKTYSSKESDFNINGRDQTGKNPGTIQIDNSKVPQITGKPESDSTSYKYETGPRNTHSETNTTTYAPKETPSGGTRNESITSKTTSYTQKSDGVKGYSTVVDTLKDGGELIDQGKEVAANWSDKGNQTTGNLMQNAERISERSSELSKKLEAMKKNLK